MNVNHREATCPVTEMGFYVGTDMAKDKFDYCTLDDELNIQHIGESCGTDRNARDAFGKNLETLKGMPKYVTIGMEFTGMYHRPPCVNAGHDLCRIAGIKLIHPIYYFTYFLSHLLLLRMIAPPPMLEPV